jgi:hypothetical protein
LGSGAGDDGPSAESGGELPLRVEGLRLMSLSPAAGYRFFLERKRAEGAAWPSSGGTGWKTSKAEVVLQRDKEKWLTNHKTWKSDHRALRAVETCRCGRKA